MKIRIKRQWNKKSVIRLIGLLIFLLLVMKGGNVHAAPAVLESETTAVYESADTVSSTVGNLIRGNTFELNEKVSAEDGSAWYRVTLSNGLTGYVPGSVLIKERTEEEEQPDEAEEPEDEEDGENEEKSEAENAEANDAADEEESPVSENGTAQEEEGEPEEEAEDEEQEPVSIGENMDNTLPKTYAAQKGGNRINVKKIENSVPAQQNVVQESKKHGIGLDLAAIAAVLCGILSAVIICSCYRRLRSVLYGMDETEKKSWLEKRKGKKRKKTKQVRKKSAGKDAMREAAKEEKKWKNSNLQK